MITKITGRLVHLGETDATLEVGAFEYQIYVPQFVRGQLQQHVGQTVSLRTIEYLEGNLQKGGRMTPRMIGFLQAAEREFFDMICQVDGVGVKKALGAMVRPVREVAVAIEERDVKMLSTLPGIGPAVAERIIAKLRRKMAKFALLVGKDLPDEQRADRDILQEGLEALVALGHSDADARQKIQQALASGKTFKTVEDLLLRIYQQGRDA